ncbi:hypothetical protein ONZ45_g10768 [Pleurotus djamor]|nr:hypothetical protein ONZ45_g10768 [Pleurotus djamor]
MLSHSSFTHPSDSSLTLLVTTLSLRIRFIDFRPLVDVTTSCSFYFYFSLYSPSSSPPVTKTVSALSVTATSPGPRKSDISELSGNLTNDLEYTYSSPSAYTSTLGKEINQNLCPTSRDGIERNGVSPARGAIFDFSMASACGGLLPSVPERRDFLRDRAENFEFKIHLDILARWPTPSLLMSISLNPVKSAPNTVQAAYDITRLVHEILGYLTPQSPGHDAATKLLMFAAPAAVMSQKHEYVTYLWFATPRNYTAEFVYIKATCDHVFKGLWSIFENSSMKSCLDPEFSNTPEDVVDDACISPSELDGAVCDARDLNALIAEFPPERRKSKNRSPGQHGRYADQSQRYARVPTPHAQVLPGVTGD